MKKRLVISIFILLFLTTITSKQTIKVAKFDLKEIYIENNSLLNADDIKKQLISIYGKNLIFLKNIEIEKKLMKNSFIEGFNIKKKYPNTLKIKIFEKKPIAILIKNKKKYYLSEKIDLIEFNNFQNFKNLPYVIGNENEFKIFYYNLKKVDFPLELVNKFVLYDSKRWDIETINKNTIKLPSENYLESLENYLKFRNQIESKKYKLFDYRINNQLILK